MRRHWKRLAWTLGILAMASLPGAGIASAAEEQAGAPAPLTESQVKAKQIMDAMARQIGGSERFSVDLVAGFEVVQASGQKIEFGEKRRVSVSRPDKLRIESEGAHAGRDLTLFDGKQIITFDAGTNVYAVSKQTAGLDDTVVHFVRDMGMRLPLAPLVMARLPQELENRVRTIDYVERTEVLGEPTHHIAGRAATVDFEMWITDGKKPMLRKIALTYREAEGQPRFWADFSDWDFSPHFKGSTFEFKPAAGARQVPFAMEVVARHAPQPSGKGAPAQGAAQ